MLKLAQPQEIEVWYVIPAIRRELVAVFLQDHNLNQKQAATLLGISEAAVSNYLKSKRANVIAFNPELKRMIKESAARILHDKKLIVKEIQDICTSFRKKELLCDVHKKYGTVSDEMCNVCLEQVSKKVG